MSAVARRVRYERDLWKAVWKQVEAFLDRVDGAADQDEPHAQTLCQLLPVLSVIERARKRTFGKGLDDARPASLRGVGLTTTTGALMPSDTRLPGLEECEYATAPVSMPDEDTKSVIMWPSEPLATFRDARRHLDGTLIIPGYENGQLLDFAPIDDAVDDGLFPFDNREDAANGEDVVFKKWSTLRREKLDALPAGDPAVDVPLYNRLMDLDSSDPLDEYRAIGSAAEAAAAGCLSDRGILAAARAELEEVGADDALIGALRAVEDELVGQAEDFAWVGDALDNPTYNQLASDRVTIERRLHDACFVDGLPGFSFKLADLDGKASAAFDTACEARMAYPDGPLRQLRMLEQGLRFFWRMRSRWMNRRFALITAPVMFQFWLTYTDGLDDVHDGRPSGLVLPVSTTTRPVNARATKVYATGIPLPATFRPGRLAMIDGPRPATMVVTDEGMDKHGLFMMTTPVELSLDTSEGLPGIPGLIDPGVHIRTQFPTFTTAEWRRGAASNAARTALLTGLIAHASRLRLLLGAGVSGDRPGAPTVPAPYPGVNSWAIEGPVTPEAARLFLTAVPTASASGVGERVGVGRPGEVMLVRGRDEEGYTWQGVAEIDHCEVLTGEEARADDELTGTPVPPCCEDHAEVMVVYLRSLEIPATLVAGLSLRRDFLGFGTRSLLSGAVLPSSLDAATIVPTVTVDGASRLVLRDRELDTALRFFEDWLGRDLGNAS